MKKNINTKDNSTPYRTLSIGKVEAPVKHKEQPKSGVIKGSGDLRGKRG